MRNLLIIFLFTCLRSFEIFFYLLRNKHIRKHFGFYHKKITNMHTFCEPNILNLLYLHTMHNRDAGGQHFDHTNSRQHIRIANIQAPNSAGHRAPTKNTETNSKILAFFFLGKTFPRILSGSSKIYFFF